MSFLALFTLHIPYISCIYKLSLSLELVTVQLHRFTLAGVWDTFMTHVLMPSAPQQLPTADGKAQSAAATLRERGEGDVLLQHKDCAAKSSLLSKSKGRKRLTLKTPNCRCYYLLKLLNDGSAAPLTNCTALPVALT